MIKWCNTAHVSSRWDDDVVFRNQVRGTETKGKKEFVNVLFHHTWISVIGVDIWVVGSLALRFS